MIANLFIVGAAKCGTTSFHDYLNQHPMINMSNQKELNYFNFREIEKDNLYYRGNTLVKTDLEYSRQFDYGTYKYYGESSVSYLFYKKTAEKIFHYNPNAKIIIFLRNPIYRAYSHYLMDYNAGYINCSISDIINNNCSPNEYQQIISLGLYYSQVKRYLDLFKNNVSIHIFEEWNGNELNELHKIENLLDITKCDKYDINRKNKFFEPKFKILKFFNRSVRLKAFTKKIIPKKHISFFKGSIPKEKIKPELSNDLKLKLFKFYRDDIIKLSDLISIDLENIWHAN